jgi:uncharacterized protein (DUF2336 family)
MSSSRSPVREADVLELSLEAALRSRAFLVQRLTDVVSWPASRIPVYERELAADVLVGLLRSAGAEQRRRCAVRLAPIVDAPKLLLRYLARDDAEVARPLLEESKALDDADLVATIRSGLKPHWLMIAGRRALSPFVCEALVGVQDYDVATTLLRNGDAKLSHGAVQALVSMSRNSAETARLLAQRAETTPAQALTLFWWADSETRLVILRRFPVDRAVIISELADVFSIAASEEWADGESRKALALIERRQRNRLAAERSPYKTLEAAIQALRGDGDKRLLAEISHMAGIRPAAGARIFADRGGEPLAVLCKAVGLKRPFLAALWRGLGRSDDDAGGRAAFARVSELFEMLATAKAQTVLRYWNWSLTTGVNPGLAGGVDPDSDVLEFSPAQRSAALVFGIAD